MNQIDALNRLNKEKDYEDKLAKNLTYYFIDCLKDITDITSQEKEEIKEKLNIIKFDSIRHAEIFNKLIQLVMENEQNNY